MDGNELKSLLSRFHIRPDKRLGQSFLLSEKVLDGIVKAGELGNSDIVLEIGPGLGFLTKRLAVQAGEVIAVEKDKKLVKALRKLMKQYKNLKIIHGDALQLTIYNLPLPTNYKIIANIPYYLTGKLLQNFLTAKTKPSVMVLLLQKEVAERIVAKPGQMSLLSVSVQFYANPEIIDYVPKENFYPEPEVDSAIVKLKFHPHPTTPFGVGVDEKKFFQLVKIGFSNKRKQLQNNLKGVMGEKGIKGILAELGINPLARAQDLSLDQWCHLTRSVFL